MAENGSYRNTKEDGVTEKLLPMKHSQADGSPEIKIRTPGRSACHRTESIRLKRFDLIPDAISTFQAAREGRLKILKNLDEIGENLEENDTNGFAPIHHATRANHVEIIRFLLDSGVDLDTKGGIYQLTPLHVSVRFNCFEATKFLISREADPSIKSTDGTSPLHFAARHALKEICELLLGDKRSDVNVPDNSGVTAFHLACSSGNVELCELFLDHGADVFILTAEGRNSLHIAASYGHSEIVEKLIQIAEEQNVEIERFVNSYDSANNTPLHLACKKGYVETVKVCLKYNADLEARNDIVSNTPLHVAAQAGLVDIVQILIDAGGSVALANALHRLPIHLASLFNHCKVVNCLLENASPIDPRDGSSLTPLLCAVMAGRLMVTKQLITAGVDTGSRTESLQTCIHLAVENRNIDMLELLVDAIGNEILEIGDQDLRLPLHHCAYAGQFELMQFLLSRSPNHHPKDNFGKTPLHMAAENGHMDCVKALAETSQLHIEDTDDTNSTPLQEAAKNGHRNVCKYLLRLGADVTSKNTNRWTALHHAAYSGHVRTVEVLLQSKTVGSSQTIDEQDSDGNTPLLLAASKGHVDVVQLLINREADITTRNKRKMTCLDEAVESNKLTVVMAIIQSDRWFEVVTHRPQDERYPMKALIEKMPQATNAVLDRCIKFSELPPEAPEYFVECDFRLLDSLQAEEEVLGKKSPNHFYAPTTMIENEREDLLSHPVVKAFLRLKWKRIGRPLRNLSVVLYVIYVVLFTHFLVARRESSALYKIDDNKTYEEHKKMFKKGMYDMGIPIFITIVIILQAVKEIFQMCFQGLRYFKSMENYLDWVGFCLAVAFLFPHLFKVDPYAGTGILWPLGASAILVMYFTLILSLRCFASIGIYISMFIEILKTMGKVLAIISLFVFSFTLVFYTLLKEEPPFRTLGWSFIKTSMMVIGDINYDTLITDNIHTRNPVNGAPYVPVPLYTAFILMLFGFIMAVLFMNLLVGLAVGDIDGIQRNASFKRKAMKVNLIVELENRYPRKLIEMFGIKPVMVFKPNETTGLTNRFWFKFLYSIDVSAFLTTRTTEKELDLVSELIEQKSRTKELQESMEEQKKLLVSMAKQLQMLSGFTTPHDIRLAETVEFDRPVTP